MENTNKSIKVDDKVFLTENVRTLFGFKDGIEFKVEEILEDNVTCPYVLSNKDFGKDWREFFAYDELIPVREI